MRVYFFEGWCGSVKVGGAPDLGHGVCGKAGLRDMELCKEDVIIFGCVDGAVVDLTRRPARCRGELEDRFDLGRLYRV